jgi:sporulation-control protein spo0M
MARCELLIELDRREPYLPGETIRGQVLVRGAGDERIRRLTLTLEWATSGRGNRDRGGRLETVLGEALRLPNAGGLELPFQLTAPAAPPSYAGRLLSVEWSLRAHADLAWARDPAAQVPITIGTGAGVAPAAPAEPYLRGLPVAELPAASREKLDAVPEAASMRAAFQQLPGAGRAVLGCFALLFLLPVVAGLLVALLSTVTGGVRDAGAALLVNGVLLAAVGALVLVLKRHRIAEYRIGRTSLKLLAQTLRPGEPLQFFIRFAPRLDIEIPTITAVLRARETVVSGSGKSRSTHSHTARELAISLAEPRRIAAGEDMVFVGRIDVPPDAPCTFDAPNNKVKWTLDVHVAIPGWPDWKRSVPVEVRV